MTPPGTAPADGTERTGGSTGTTAGASTATATGSTPVDRVELRVPADPAYLTVLRTATAGLAARLDLTLDEIEDLRIAVDEACALVLGPQALDGSADPAAVHPPPAPARDDDLVAVFDLVGGGLVVEVSGPAQTLPSRDSFAWAVLEALVGSLETEQAGASGRSSIRLSHAGTPRAT